MNKQRPSNLAVLTMVAFTASCVGLLIFLWISFGGTLPFNAQGYRFSVEFNQATELGSNAEVEIAGVTVGHVASVGLDHRTGLTLPAQAPEATQLDQILSTFDPTTRKAFETWMQQGGAALSNRGEQFNAAFAELYPFATNVNSVLAVLQREKSATSTLLRWVASWATSASIAVCELSIAAWLTK